jgi:hypothetical protein
MLQNLSIHFIKCVPSKFNTWSERESEWRVGLNKRDNIYDVIILQAKIFSKAKTRLNPSDAIETKNHIGDFFPKLTRFQFFIEGKQKGFCDGIFHLLDGLPPSLCLVALGRD